MTSLPFTTERQKTEWQKILSIAENNNFTLHLIKQLKTQIQHKTHMDKTNNRNKKWATFTYHSPKLERSPTFQTDRHQGSIQKHEHNTTNQTDKP
jgi:hypothetical protein